MSNTPTKSARAPMPAFGAFGAHQAPASLLLEKSHPGLRRSTPDSEALASSDDEIEHTKSTASNNIKTGRTVRRTSWLNDTSTSNTNRKPSITGPYSPSGSHPGTPGTEVSAWANVTTSNPSGWPGTNTSFANTGWPNIWSQDGRKDPPARLQEVLPTNGDAGIPFTIPLQPTPKTYRSQSYSVGQLDTTSASTANPVSTSSEATRARLGSGYPPPTLQRRTSRTSGLGTLDSGGLGRLREDDGEEDLRGPQESYNTEQARMIELLEKENAQLRYAAQNRDRTLSATAATTQLPSSTFRNSRLRAPVPEEIETAIDDRDDLGAMSAFADRDINARRMSEQAGMYVDKQSFSPSDGRPFDGAKKAQWSTSLGFGPIPEAPQSRRHSFADVPTRHGSFSSTGEQLGWPLRHSQITRNAGREDEMTAYESGSQAVSQTDDRKLAFFKIYPSVRRVVKKYSPPREPSALYFNTTESTRQAADARVRQSRQSRGPAIYPHLPVPQYPDATSQLLYIVNFKCCRSDVFYIQPGTGWNVNVGDLVIVEADRGTDLGTVQHTDVSWDDARRYKDYYAEEHYKWLMMFSMQSRNGGPNVVNPNGMPGRQGSAVGGMGPQGHHGLHDAAHPDLKPKMIKRQAQNHEIQALKDKEGNEAKAKRVCQQKVIDHRLNMEILDAEFQMDSKKLTFYYFADNYINFNHLVTDLFKIYKTRIWMSAINPASFQTPTASLGLTPAYSGAPPGDERHRRRQPPATQNNGQQAVTTPFGDTFDADRTFNGQNSAMRSPYFGQFPDGGAGPQPLQPGMAAFGGNVPPGQMDPFSFYGQPYPALNPNAPNFASNRHDFRPRGPNQPGDGNWMGRFQGLSLNS